MSNDYIAQRDAIRREFFLAGMELEGQRTVDMLCLVLHDPEIMGKDTLLALSGCTEAEKVNYNIAKQADYFESERRVTVYNARTDKIVL